MDGAIVKGQTKTKLFFQVHVSSKQNKGTNSMVFDLKNIMQTDMLEHILIYSLLLQQNNANLVLIEIDLTNVDVTQCHSLCICLVHCMNASCSVECNT